MAVRYVALDAPNRHANFAASKVEKQVTKIGILGFALTEAVALFALLIAFLILFK